jgi:hypothetical protein
MTTAVDDRALPTATPKEACAPPLLRLLRVGGVVRRSCRLLQSASTIATLAGPAWSVWWSTQSRNRRTPGARSTGPLRAVLAIVAAILRYFGGVRLRSSASQLSPR